MNPSASSVPRALRCLGSLVLPQQDYRTKFAEDGQDNHAEMEAAADVGDIDALPRAVRDLILPDDALITETSFAYDVASDTARRVGGPREYSSLRPFEIGCTPDLAIYGNGRLVVVDYKNFEEVDAADENTQAATYALALCRHFGLDSATVAIVYLGGLLRPSIATLGALDLDVHAARLKQLHLDAAKASAEFAQGVMPPLAAGVHCKYCPAFVAGENLCPEQAKLARRAESAIPMEIESLIPLESDEDAARTFDLWQRLKMLTARVGAALHARAADRAIPLPDGMVFGTRPVQGKREIDPDKAYEKIRAKYGQEVADAAVRRKIAQTWIVDALKAANVPGAPAKKDALVKELEAEGAVKRKESTTVDVHDPRKLLKEAV
jgi:hypothetical protein